MRELNKTELLNIDGGNNWLTTAFFTAVTKSIESLLELGRSLGTAIRSAITGNVCPV